MTRIGLLFELKRVETRPGETVRVVGDRPELGQWNPFDPNTNSTLELRTGATSYPRWGLLSPVWINIGRNSSITREVSEMEVEGLLSAEALSTPRSLRKDGSCEDFDSNNDESHSEIPSMIQVEYKYIKDRKKLAGPGPSVQWEDSIQNRRVVLPCEQGSIWIVSDTRFNDHGSPEVMRASLPEVVKRWCDIDPEWTCQGNEHRASPEWSEWNGDAAPASPCSSKTYWSGHTTSTGCFV